MEGDTAGNGVQQPLDGGPPRVRVQAAHQHDAEPLHQRAPPLP